MKKGGCLFIIIVLITTIMILFKVGIENWYVEKDFGQGYKLFIDADICYTKFNSHGQSVIPIGVTKYNYNSKYIIAQTKTKTGYSYDSIGYTPGSNTAKSFFDNISQRESYLTDYWIIRKHEFDTVPNDISIFVDGIKCTTIENILIGPLDSISFYKKLKELSIDLSLK